MPFWLRRLLRLESEYPEVVSGGTSDDIRRARELIERYGLQRLLRDKR